MVAVFVFTLNLSGAIFPIFPVIVLIAPLSNPNFALGASLASNKNSSIEKLEFFPILIIVSSLKITWTLVASDVFIVSFSCNFAPKVASILCVPLSIDALPLSAVIVPTALA